MPFGEKMEKPDDDPTEVQPVLPRQQLGMESTNILCLAAAVGYKRAHHV